MTVRVLVVEESAVLRNLLRDLLGDAEGIEVVGAAPDPFVAWEQIKALRPDVLTLGVEARRMDGLSFLEKLMTFAPMPVVMVGPDAAQRDTALLLGAIEHVVAPVIDFGAGRVERAAELVAKVRLAARHAAPARRLVASSTTRAIAIGASTGGTEALRELLGALPADAPAVLIAQHLPARFTRAFAERLDGHCAARVSEAADGDLVLPGRVLIAPGDRHLAVRSVNGACTVELRQTPPVNRHRPSVDVLFESCAAVLGKHAVGVIMTGMGADGARGLLAMRRSGARTLAQDERSCVVFGMPKAAIACGAVDEVVSLDDLPAALLGA